MVIPVFGPGTVRDAVGLVLDLLFNPLHYQEDASMRSAYLIADQVDGRASVLAIEELIIGNEYTFVRDAYLQRRRYLVKDGEIDNFFDF